MVLPERPGRAKSTFRGPEVRADLMCSRNSSPRQEPSEVGEGTGDEATEGVRVEMIMWGLAHHVSDSWFLVRMK